MSCGEAKDGGLSLAVISSLQRSNKCIEKKSELIRSLLTGHRNKKILSLTWFESVCSPKSTPVTLSFVKQQAILEKIERKLGSNFITLKII